MSYTASQSLYSTTTQPSTSSWTRFTRNDCPICAGQRKKRDCRQSPSGVVHCRSHLDPPQGWQFIGEDSLGFSRYILGEASSKRPSHSPTRSPQPKLNVLSDHERDRQFRQIAKHSGLSLAHRAKLEARGPSPNTIERWYQQRLIWTWATGEKIPGTTPELPGIDPRKGTLRADFYGYAIAIPSATGHILGSQIKPNNGSGYFWVSSAKFGGNDQRLSTNETPIGLYGSPSNTLNFVEGYLKAAISADRFGLCCVGAAGGHWARSPVQLRDMIQTTGATQFILNPDGGMIDLKHRSVIAAYHRLHTLLKQWGYTLTVRWWGQTTKTDGDIDEISQQTFGQSTLISWPDFLNVLEYDWNSEESFKQLLFKSKLKLDHIARRIARGFGYSPPKPQKSGSAQTQRQSTSPEHPPASISALACWQPERKWVLEVTPASIPDVEEWHAMGSPQLYCPREDHNNVLVSLLQKGYKTILLNGTGGDGKTHRAGEFAQRWPTLRQQIDGSQQATLHFVTPNYRNPDTETVENIEEKVSPAALTLDASKTTPLGQPHRKRHHQQDTPPDIPGLCIEDSRIQRLQARGLIIDRSVKSSYCTAICGQAFSCPYLQAKQAQGRPAAIREHISTISLTPDDEAPDQNGDVIIIDEAGKTIAPFGKKVDATLHDLDVEIGRFAQVHPQLYLKFKTVFDAIIQPLKRTCLEQCGAYPLTHAEVTAFLPSVQDLETLFFECAFQDWLDPHTDVWAETRLTLSQLMTLLHKACNPNTWKDVVETASNNGVHLSSNALEEWLSPQPIYRTYQALLRPATADLTISPSGLITFTYRDTRITRPLKEARATILMDATPNLWEISRVLGVRTKDIVRLADYKPTYTNLTIKIIQGLGNTCATRASLNTDGTLKRNGQYDIQIRVKKAIAKIAESSERSVGLLDYKKFIASYHDIPKLTLGYCFNDNRGSNRFKDCDRLISVALATPNLGAKLTEFHLLTGQAHTLKTASGQFWKCQKTCQVNELIQDGFRLRAQHRPHQAMEWYILSEQTTATQMAQLKAHFPGCAVETVPIMTLCPEAAPKGLQMERALIQTLYAQISSGQQASIDSVAQQIGRSKGRLSQIAKTLHPQGFRSVKQSLVLLYQTLESKTKLSELPEDLQTIAVDYLPAIAELLVQNELSAADALEQLTILAEDMSEAQMQDVLNATPPEAIATLITAFLQLAADGALEWLIQDFRQQWPVWSDCFAESNTT